jgi:hypothetical protein
MNRTSAPQRRRTAYGALLLALAAMQLGCQTARYVRKDGFQGEVAIPANSNSWPYYHRKQAEKLMAEHFPEGYEVEVEEEAVIGQRTDYSENGSGVGAPVRIGRGFAVGVGVGNRTGTATTTNKTEWRLRYRRKGAPQHAYSSGAEEVPNLQIGNASGSLNDETHVPSP